MTETMGSRLRVLRGKLDQADVAAAVGIARSTLAGIESGGDLPGRDALFALADYYKVSLDYLRTGEPSLSPKDVKVAKNADELALLEFWRNRDREERVLVTRLLRGIEATRNSAA